MEISDREIHQAERRMQIRRSSVPLAVTAKYDRRAGRVRVALSNGVEFAFPPAMAEGLAEAPPEALARIEITPAGLGLHWPALDADLYLPALLEGIFGSPRWMAERLGRSGGSARSPAKAAAARENGRKGGRPRKVAGA